MSTSVLFISVFWAHEGNEHFRFQVPAKRLQLEESLLTTGKPSAKNTHLLFLQDNETSKF